MTRFQVWTVRNTKGQFIATFRAISAARAIGACLDADAVQGSQFRRYTRLLASDLTAAVEPQACRYPEAASPEPPKNAQ